jgi:PAS domain S-box-containing protein
MDHKRKIASSNRTVYYLILTAGLFMSLAVLYGLFIGLRINFVYTSLLDSSLEIKSNVTKARSEFLKEPGAQTPATFRQAMEYLDVAELKASSLLEEKELLNIISIPIDKVALSEEVQKLQVLLLNYRGLSSKVSSKDSTQSKTNIRQEWESLYSNVEAQSNKVEKEVRNVLGSFVKVFRITQLGLAALSLVLCLVTIVLIYRSEKQRNLYTRKLEGASLDLQKGLHRTTKVEKALSESQRKLSTLIQNLPGMVYRCKLGQVWEFDYLSSKCFQITGYKEEELLGNKIISYYEDLIHKEDHKKVIEQIHKAVEQKKPYQLVYRINTALGYEKWVWEQGVGIFSNLEDELIALEGFITDITEQKTVEDQLSLQSNALEAAANGIVICDKDGTIIWANTAFTSLTGYSIKEVIGKKTSIFKSGVHDDNFYKHMWGKINVGETWRGEIVNKRKNGANYWEEMQITPIKNSRGEITNFIAIKQDITERKKADESLKESELRFRGLYENATIGIYRSTPKGKILLANPTLIKIAGYDSIDELLNLNAKDTYAEPEAREIFKKEIEKNGKIFGLESKWKKKDGSIIYIRESARAIKDNEGRYIYYEGTIEDITDKKLTEEALIEAKERAEQSDRLKSEFLAQMSHEIRTPLNVILSFTGMMKDELQDKVEEELAKGFDVINEEGKRIMRTVELILNMSELQTGSYSYRAKHFDLFNDIIQKQFKNFQPVAATKKIQFNLNNPGVNTTIEADEYSINQIFHHLIDNAIKYTHKGKVEITINRSPRNNLYVDVSDTGIGIAEEYLPLLFTPFSREEQGYTRNFEGNGLGLALAKKYCELNGAEIKASSIKGKGTTFRVTFPDHN